MQRYRLLLLLVILLSTFCLMWELDAKSLWIDEYFTAKIARQPTAAAVIAAVQETEGRPPLYYLLLHYWTFLAGHSDYALRFFSLLFAIPCLPLLYSLTRRWVGEQIALTAVGLLAFSPLYLLYSRMARAYFMGVCSALAASYFLFRLIEAEGGWAWVGYVVSALGLLYTDYLSASTLLAHNLFVLVDWRRSRPMLSRWLAAQLCLVVGFMPWLPGLLGQTARYQGEQRLADLSQGFLGYLVKLAQPVLVFSIGETLFPWNPAALVGLPAMAALALVGAIVAWRTRRPAGALVVLSALVPVLFTVFVVTGWLVRYMTFAWIGARSLHALPFFLLLVACGLHSVRSAKRRNLLMGLIAVVFAVAAMNYYTNREFHNPVYVIPSKEIVKQVVSEALPGDVIVAPMDSLFDYYYQSDRHIYPIFDSNAPEEIQTYIAGQQSPRVWLVTVSRDRGRELEPSQFLTWLERGYAPVKHWGYAEQSTLYRRFKAALIKREAYQYKAELTLYERRP